MHSVIQFFCLFFFFFNDTATTEIYTLSLHDALPICISRTSAASRPARYRAPLPRRAQRIRLARSEEHTSELQSPCNLVCRLLLEKKKTNTLFLPSSTRRPYKCGQRYSSDAIERGQTS